MSSYYTNQDVLDAFPLNYDELDDEEKVRVIQDIAMSFDMSVDKVLEIMNS